MLSALVALCLRRRGTVLALAAALLLYGGFVARDAPLDVLPDFAPPQVTVQCEAPGFSAEQVETLVTAPIEAALAGAGNLESFRSQSIQGLCVVTAVFVEHTDIYKARQLLAEQLAQVAAELPDGVDPPALTPLTSATMDLLKIGLVCDQLSLLELRTFADWTVVPRLRAVAGVANVTVFGGDVRQLQIEVDPARLAASGLALADVLAAARDATGARGAGFVETANQRVVLETHGEAITCEQLAETLVAWRDGQPVRLRDVALVVDGARPKFGECLIQGRPGVLVKALSQYGANTLAATRAIELALEELKPLFAAAGIEYFPRLHRPANFIEHAVANLGHSLWVGAVLIAVVLLLFLMDVRVAFISMTAIPLSLFAAVIMLQRLGMTLDTMTLGGLAIAIGEVVDDAIVDVENIVRRLRENRGLAADRRLPLFEVVFKASLEVRQSVIYATFVVITVFLPVITMSGLQGSFFRPLGLAYIFAVVASLAVALALTPALALTLLGRGERGGRDGRGGRDANAAAKPHREPLLARALKRVYTPVLQAVLRHPRLVLSGAVALLAGAIAVVPFLGAEFLPEFREGHFVMQLSLAPGVSLDEMKRLGARVGADLLANPHIATVAMQIGRAELGEDPWAPNRSESHIELNPLPPEIEAGVGNEIRAVLDQIPGIQYELLTFLGDRIGESISGETAQVVVSVFADDLSVLDAKAAEIAGVCAQVTGAVDVARGSLGGLPALAIDLRRDALLRYGLAPVPVLDAIKTAYQGERVGQIHDGTKTFDVAVILPEARRRDPDTVGELLLRSPSGALVPLRELADVELATGRSMILREGGRRRQTVTCNVSGRDVASFAAELRQRVLRDVTPPAAGYFEFGGAAEQQRAATHELLLHGALAGIAVILLLTGAFRRTSHLLLVLANLPFAFVGGVIAVLATGGTLSMGSLVGFVTLFGVTMRNSILLISHLEHLRVVEKMEFGLELVLRGARERLLPITMTALVTGLGLLPIALGSGSAGREIEGPMAIVILGGLATSTVLNLLLLPALALRFWGRTRA